MFKNEGGGGGVKGRLNNVKKNRRFGTGEGPLGLGENVNFWISYLDAYIPISDEHL